MRARRILLPLSAALVAAVAGASPTGLLIQEAAAQVGRRPDEDDDTDDLLLLARPQPRGDLLAAHGSHRSHSSHRSHTSGSGRGGFGGSYGGSGADEAPAPPPPPPKPATVTFTALPGGRITIDGVVRGQDATGLVVLQPGSYEIKVENKFLGAHTVTVNLSDGQKGNIIIDW